MIEITKKNNEYRAKEAGVSIFRTVYRFYSGFLKGSQQTGPFNPRTLTKR